MENKISKYHKYCILIYVLMILNYILLALIGSGIFDGIASSFFEKCFILSSMILPYILVVSLLILKSRLQEVDIYQKNDISIYVPFIQSVLIILLFGVKFIIQLDRIILMELLITTLTFVFVNVVLVLYLIEKEISKKKFNIVSIISCVLTLVYILFVLILSHDYSVLL